MYDFIISEIKRKLQTEKGMYVSILNQQYNYIKLLYLKYLCDKNNITEYKNQKELKKIISINNQELYKEFFEKNINELLVHFQNNDVIKLLEEFIKDKGYNVYEELDKVFIEKDEKVLYYFNISDMNNMILFRQNVIKNKIKIYEIIDEMNNVHREICTDLSNINLKEFDTLVIVDDEPTYKYISNNYIVDMLYKIIFSNNSFTGKILFKVRYSKISILKDYMLIGKLSKVCIYENQQDAILIFDKYNKEDTISIIMVNDKNHNNLKQILEKNKQNKKYLLKVPHKVVISNNYRIGFKMYLPDRKEEVKSINDIVDENTKITEKITRLNKLIREEMDKLISK